MTRKPNPDPRDFNLTLWHWSAVIAINIALWIGIAKAICNVAGLLVWRLRP